MKVSVRMLRKWRAEALAEIYYLKGWDSTAERSKDLRTANERIVKLTQDLLDTDLLKQYLKRKATK